MTEENLLLKPPQYKVTKTSRGIRREFLYTSGQRFSEYRSHAELFGYPLVCIANGIHPETGKTAVARGVIAIGQRACGVVAIGQMATGVVAIGQLAWGSFIAIGQVAAAPLAVGQVAVGIVAAGMAGAAVAGAFLAGYAFWGWMLSPAL